LNLCTRIISRGTSGTIEARVATSEIIPFFFPARSAVIATTGVVKFRSRS